MRRSAGLLAALVIATGCAAAAGCGAGDPGSGAISAAEAYLHDLADQRYDAACGLLTDDLKRQLGDCPAALRKHHGDLPVTARDELRYVRVRKATYHGDGAQVYPQDVTTDRTTTAGPNGTPKPKTTRVHSIAAHDAMGGQPLSLTKVGKVWRISGGSV